MFGERLKYLRNLHKLTQSELATILKLSKANVSKYENGNLEPNIETLNILSSYFCVSTDYLLGRTDKKIAHPTETDGHAIIRYDSDKLSELMAVISTLPESEQEKLLDFAKYQATRLDKPKDK